MNTVLNIDLETTQAQSASLDALQKAFSAVCNALGPIVRQTRCWNRVGLHHLAYRVLRESFPQVGSQMVCNAIYSVSRTSRIVFQHPQSPWNIAKLGDKPLPLLRFQPNSPVYFDRHTLSLKDGLLSMYTLDGRIRFQVALAKGDEARFHQEKLREIVLTNTGNGFRLSFYFSATDEEAGLAAEVSAELPEYLLVTSESGPGDGLSPDALAKAIPPSEPTSEHYRINHSC